VVLVGVNSRRADVRMRVPRRTPHIRIDRGGGSGGGDDVGGIVAVIIVIAFLYALFGLAG